MVDESRTETADRVATHQTNYQVIPVYATRTTNCCGCLEEGDFYCVLRFPCCSPVYMY